MTTKPARRRTDERTDYALLRDGLFTGMSWALLGAGVVFAVLARVTGDQRFIDLALNSMLGLGVLNAFTWVALSVLDTRARRTRTEGR